MPAPEFRRWQLFYILEPWGWHNEEYQTAAMRSMIYNVNAERKHQKGVETFTRDMLKLIEAEMTQEERNHQARIKFEKMDIEERKQVIAKIFGRNTRIV